MFAFTKPATKSVCLLRKQKNYSFIRYALYEKHGHLNEIRDGDIGESSEYLMTFT